MAPIGAAPEFFWSKTDPLTLALTTYTLYGPSSLKNQNLILVLLQAITKQVSHFSNRSRVIDKTVVDIQKTNK